MCGETGTVVQGKSGTCTGIILTFWLAICRRYRFAFVLDSVANQGFAMPVNQLPKDVILSKTRYEPVFYF
jgi:hypothetical protein